ncbi:helix-turn-helix domain-containing protein [Maribellus comscasis]|uniref:Helix-turn-helix domain-containing protein n=1 Tax=Maribellus comscasis TaxID=2681766 RepID=A0A6I6JRY2_9BACT|nr:helix-turn-helix domain-containing protein [Maribellus comscasis]QGY43989.1 helix-turn-helix domain-containing protein [Maribellus comscasis]
MAEIFIEKTRQIIRTKIRDEKFGVTDLAGELGLSRSQILRKVKAATGKSVNHYIREIRLEEATKIFKTSDLTASEVAYEVGFSSPSYFNKCFLDHFGCTPGEYKKKLETETVNTFVPKGENGNRKIKIKPVLLAVFFLFLIVTGYFTVVNSINNTSAQQSSIAVLPLLDLSKNQDKEYLADGITEAITLELSKSESLRVISRGSSMKYKGENKIYSEIAKELGVDLLLEGSVLHEADSLRVVVQLIEPFPKEKHIWANSYDQNSSNILQLVSEVSNEIAGEISSIIKPTENQAQNYKINPEAFDLYLRGRHLWNTQKTRYNSLLSALDYLNKAIKKDPNFAPAYVTKAETYLSINKIIGDNLEKLDNRQKAREAINKAFELDESLAEAYITLGNLSGKLDWDWEKMKELVNVGLSIEPNNAAGHQILSNYYIIQGDYKKAIEEALIAEKLDPLNPAISCMVAERYYINGDYQKSIDKYNEVLELNPNYGFAYNGIGFVYFQVDNNEKAVESWRKLQDIMGNDALGSCYDNTKNYKDCFRFYLEKAKQNAPRFCANPVIISSVHMLVQEEQGAMDYLQIAFQYKNEDLPVMITYPDFYTLRNKSEFKKIARSVGISLPDNS